MRAIQAIENAGIYLVRSRNLEGECRLNATEAARSDNPDVQALAIFSVALAEVTGAKDDGWVKEIKSTLQLPN
jgi:hypothetical protein